MKKLLNKIVSFSLIIVIVFAFNWLSPKEAQAAASISFLQSTVDTVNRQTYTFASQNLGTAAADRVIIAVVTCSDAAGQTDCHGDADNTVTIGGVAATKVAFQGSAQKAIGIHVAAVPSGSSGDVVVTWSGQANDSGLALWRATGISATPTDTDAVGAESTTLDVAAGGYALAGCISDQTSTATWAGVTERYDQVIEGAITQSGGELAYVAQQTGLTVTCDWAVNGDTRIAVASFQAGASGNSLLLAGSLNF